MPKLALHVPRWFLVVASRPFQAAVSRPFLVALLCSVPALSCSGEPDRDVATSDTAGAPTVDTTAEAGPMIHPQRDPAAAESDTSGTAREVDATSTPADTAEWTIDATSAPARHDAPPLPILTALRTGGHPDYARMTVEIGPEAPGPPGYRVEYVDRPLIECGSGNQIFPVGDAWLEVRLEPAAAHTEAGRPTLGVREIAVEGPLLLHVYRTCDFEGIVTLVMALASPNPYRVLTLADPWRIVVDVQR